MRDLTTVSWARVLSMTLMIGVISFATQDRYDYRTMSTSMDQPWVLFSQTADQLEQSLPKNQRYNAELLSEAMTAEIAVVHKNPSVAIENYIKLSQALHDVAPLNDGLVLATASKDPYQTLKIALAWLSIDPGNKKMRNLAIQSLHRQPDFAVSLLQHEGNAYTTIQLIKVLLADGDTEQARALWLQAGKKFPQSKSLQQLSSNFIKNN